MPKNTYERLHEYADVWATRGVERGLRVGRIAPVTVGDEVGKIIIADPGSVVMHQNVSICRHNSLALSQHLNETRLSTRN